MKREIKHLNACTILFIKKDSERYHFMTSPATFTSTVERYRNEKEIRLINLRMLGSSLLLSHRRCAWKFIIVTDNTWRAERNNSLFRFFLSKCVTVRHCSIFVVRCAEHSFRRAPRFIPSELSHHYTSVSQRTEDLDREDGVGNRKAGRYCQSSSTGELSPSTH